MDAEEFLERLCGYCMTTEVWYTLWLGGDAHRFTEILHFMGVSRSGLSSALMRLLVDSLVRVVDGKYQAVSPEWMRGG